VHTWPPVGHYWRPHTRSVLWLSPSVSAPVLLPRAPITNARVARPQ
jgi:hypothetical protein